ncbi:MAG: esterase/lipase family protein, partial [Isosphaeraceae bacterium]
RTGVLVRLAEEPRRSGRPASIQIDRWFGFDAPVHLVAHAMGGLVCRTFIKRHPDRWKTMWDAERNGERGGRLVMLGTPNHGSYLTLQRQGRLGGSSPGHATAIGAED